MLTISVTKPTFFVQYGVRKQFLYEIFLMRFNFFIYKNKNLIINNNIIIMSVVYNNVGVYKQQLKFAVVTILAIFFPNMYLFQFFPAVIGLHPSIEILNFHDSNIHM